MTARNTRVQARHLRPCDVLNDGAYGRTVLLTEPDDTTFGVPMIRVVLVCGTVTYYLPRERLPITRYRD